MQRASRCGQVIAPNDNTACSRARGAGSRGAGGAHTPPARERSGKAAPRPARAAVVRRHQPPPARTSPPHHPPPPGFELLGRYFPPLPHLKINNTSLNTNNQI